MQTVRPRTVRVPEPDERSMHDTLDSSVCDDVADVVREVRAALGEGRYEDVREMAHPHAMRREAARLARRFGAEPVEFWPEVRSHVEAVRIVGEGAAEAYEEIRHPERGAPIRLCCMVEHVGGRWRITDSREATDERLMAVLFRGAPPEEPLDAEAWTRAWTAEHEIGRAHV